MDSLLEFWQAQAKSSSLGSFEPNEGKKKKKKGKAPKDLAGNSPSEARQIGTYGGGFLESFRAKDFVGQIDRNDYYKFAVAAPVELKASLTGLKEDADFAILDSRFQIVGVSVNEADDPEFIEASLDKGVHYVWVQSFATEDLSFFANTFYNLTLQFTDIS